MWHVNDLKISHVSPAVVTGVIEQLNAKLGALSLLTVTHGKVHDYLGMMLDYLTPGKVRVTMTNYIVNMLDELPDDIDGVVITPAVSCLFDINTTNPELLDQETRDMFHANVAMLLFLSKHAWPDIQTAMGFLCMHKKSPDRDDYGKWK